jgi:hypothetical protein
MLQYLRVLSKYFSSTINQSIASGLDFFRTYVLSTSILSERLSSLLTDIAPTPIQNVRPSPRHWETFRNRTCGQKEDVVLRCWGRLHSEELHDYCTSSTVIGMTGLTGMS